MPPIIAALYNDEFNTVEINIFSCRQRHTMYNVLIIIIIGKTIIIYSFKILYNFTMIKLYLRIYDYTNSSRCWAV